MPRKRCTHEVKEAHGNLKLAIRQALAAGGAYIVFSTDKNDKDTRLQERLRGIRDGIRDATNNEFPNAVVDFYRANKLAIRSTNIPQLRHGP